MIFFTSIQTFDWDLGRQIDGRRAQALVLIGGTYSHGKMLINQAKRNSLMAGVKVKSENDKKWMRYENNGCHRCHRKAPTVVL